MTLTIQTEEDAQRQLKMTIGVAEERVQQAMRRTAAKVANQMQIPGFRKGKAPYHVVARYVGHNALRAEAVDEIFPAILKEAFTQAEVEPYITPDVDNLQLEPLQITLNVPLRPVVDLGDYRSMRKEELPIEVSEEEIQKALEQIRDRHQIVEPVERPAQPGDVVTMSGRGHLVEDNRSIFDDESYEFVLEAGDIDFGPPFVDNLVGMAAGDQKTFRMEIPADPPDVPWAGKEVEFDITLLDVKSRTRPELGDELAQEEGDYETLAELREAVVRELTENVAEEAREKRFEVAFEEFTSQAQIVYPPAALKAELDEIISNLKEMTKTTGWKWEDYLKLNAGSEEDLREKWHDEALNRLRRRLVMHEFMSREKLTVSQSEVEAAFVERYGHFHADAQNQFRKYMMEGEGLVSLTSDVLLAKIKERTEAILTGRAPDLDNLEAAGTIAEEEE
ncbi:MAG: trigger factor [Chloroflexota bacterium]